jgi:molybdate transport system substrate-binding protein
LVSQWGPSMGNTPQAVPARLARGEQIDVVIMVGYALGNLATQGKVVADSCVELARSGIGVAVREGAPKPDIGSVEALKRALLAAKSIAYSDSASGVYISSEMFQPKNGNWHVRVWLRLVHFHGHDARSLRLWPSPVG